VLAQAGALSFTGPTQLSGTQSTTSATNTVQTGQATQVYSETSVYVGPQTILTGNRGICQTTSVPPAPPAPFAPVLTACTGGTSFTISPGSADYDTLRSSFVTISQTVTTTNTTLTSQVYELDGFTTPYSPCDINQDRQTNVLDAQGEINEALGGAKPANDLNGDGVVNVVDIQIVINAALSLGCSASGAAPANLTTPVKPAARNAGIHNRMSLSTAPGVAPIATAPLPTIASVVSAAIRGGPLPPRGLRRPFRPLRRLARDTSLWRGNCLRREILRGLFVSGFAFRSPEYSGWQNRPEVLLVCPLRTQGITHPWNYLVGRWLIEADVESLKCPITRTHAPA